MKRKSAAIFFNYQFKDAAKAAINELHEAKIWTEKRTIDFSTISEYIYLSRNCPFCEYSSKVSIFLRTLNIMVFVENPLDDVVNSFDHFKWRETITRDMTRVLLHLQNELEKVGVVFGCDGYKLYDVHDQENFLSVNDKKTGFLTGGTDLIIAPHGIEELEKVSKQNCVTFKLKTAEEVKEKGKQTCLKKYGVESHNKANEIKEKIKNTCLKKYGFESHNQANEVKEIKKMNNLEKYGVEYISQLKEVKEKVKNTCLEKYGVEYISQLKEVKEKVKNTCLEKYGVECPLQLKRKQ